MTQFEDIYICSLCQVHAVREGLTHLTRWLNSLQARKKVSALIPSNSLAFLHIFSGCYILKHLSEHIQIKVKYKLFGVNYVLSEDNIFSQSGAHFLLYFSVSGTNGLIQFSGYKRM